MIGHAHPHGDVVNTFNWSRRPKTPITRRVKPLSQWNRAPHATHTVLLLWKNIEKKLKVKSLQLYYTPTIFFVSPVLKKVLLYLRSVF